MSQAYSTPLVGRDGRPPDIPGGRARSAPATPSTGAAEHTLDAEELDMVNDIVAASIETWGLPARVERLALPSLLYSEADLEHMCFLLLDEPGAGGIAVAAWESAALDDVPQGARGLHPQPARASPRRVR